MIYVLLAALVLLPAVVMSFFDHWNCYFCGHRNHLFDGECWHCGALPVSPPKERRTR